MPSARPYQRRRSGPVKVVVGVLAVCAALTWVVVLTAAGGPAGPAACPAPVAGPLPGEVLPDDALAAVEPVAPAAAQVAVLNAGGQRGQANLVAAQLADLGFGEAAPPANDPLFPEGEMECRGQLRFGPAAEGAASTVALVVPCTELVRDDTRTDAVVEVVVGTGFVDVDPPRPVRDVLDRLRNPGGGSDGSANVGEADTAPPAAAPRISPDLLDEARDVDC